ncbi:MAG: type III pantothenate kinase, partial [Candidatus Eisenbacteria bacterium]
MTPIKKIRRPTVAGPALLAVDVGNSETTIGVFQDEHLVLHWRLRSAPRTSDETHLLLRQLVAPEAIDLAGLPSVLCSVVPGVTEDFAAGLERLTGVAPVVVSAASVPSMAIRYHDPSAVGPDRLANAIAARELYGTPAIVVDLGTATTFDVVGEDGDYLGGAITPGLWVSAEELFRRAARLGRVELKRPEQAIGRTPEESLQSGIVLGHAALVDGMVSRILAELGGRAHVVATGGLAPLLKDEAGTIEHFDEGLTLKGLRLIHDSSAHPETLAAWAKKQESRSAARARNASKIEHEPVAQFDDEPELDDSEIIVVTGPDRSSAPSRLEREDEPEPERERRPPRGARGTRAKSAARPERPERPARPERAP